MKGYFVTDGYMGYMNGKYMLFSDESEYYEIAGLYIEETEE